MPNILVIDDNPDIAKALKVLFTLNDINCLSASTPEDGLKLLQEQTIDLVIQDMNFTADTTSGSEGIGLFQKIREIDADIPVILLTAWANLETAVTLVKAGAADYISKPWDDYKLLATAKNLLELHELQEQYRDLNQQRASERGKLESKFDLCNMVFESDNTLQLLKIATQIAHAQVPVLITGPNGSGKEKIAEIIQANSTYKDGPFVKVNVGALPNDLIEAELFGAEAGAYTGSQKKRKGRFEAANKGTLFLDEIGNLSLEGQMKLLRVLQTGEFERLGSTETIKVDVRIISATNSDLKTAISTGEFREDLYYRLNVIELPVPALADRKMDILPLARNFLEQDYTLNFESEDLLLKYHWPGNVRELQNCIKRACLLAQNKTITPKDLNLDSAIQSTPKPERQSHEPSKNDIINALKTADGVVAKAARSLGLSRQALYRRMEKFGIDQDDG